MYYEETEWCLRARDAGWDSMVQPRARMTHLKRSGIGVPGPYAAYYLTRNRYFFARDCLGIDPELAMRPSRRRTWEREDWRARVDASGLRTGCRSSRSSSTQAKAGRTGGSRRQTRRTSSSDPSADDVLAGGQHGASL